MKTGISTVGKAAKARGYTYIVMLAALVIVAILAEAGSVSSQYQKRRDQEQELLFRGMQYRQAIESYYFAKKQQPAFPRNLEELLKDSRFVHKRHLRRLYEDPVSGEDWQLIRAADGGIAGLASSSRDEPLKKSNFPVELNAFEGASSYSDWVFEYKPPRKNNNK